MLPGLECPILAARGTDHEYGALEQIEGMRRRAAHTGLAHSPGAGIRHTATGWTNRFASSLTSIVVDFASLLTSYGTTQ